MYKVNKIDLDIDRNVSDYIEARGKLNHFWLFWIPVLYRLSCIRQGS